MKVRKLFYGALVAFLSLFCSVGLVNAQEPPVKVQFGHTRDPMSGTRYSVAFITALQDNLTLTGLRVNRGNCRESIGNPSVPLPIPFGQTVKYLYLKCNSVIEAEVFTNQGNWTFK